MQVERDRYRPSDDGGSVCDEYNPDRLLFAITSNIQDVKMSRCQDVKISRFLDKPLSPAITERLIIGGPVRVTG